MSHETSVQPKLNDLLANYLDRQAQAESQGLAHFDAAEVLPYESGPVQPIDPKLAWEEALTLVPYFKAGLASTWKIPPQWSYLVGQHEPEVALPWCVGNFPQMVRNFHVLLQQDNRNHLRPRSERSLAVSELQEWAAALPADSPADQVLLALAGLRLAKQFEEANALIAKFEGKIPSSAHGLWENEKAALAWHQGQSEEALKLWEKSPPTLPNRFNRGMANLFLGHKEQAREILSQVVAELPESGAWHHLARLYLTLAQMR